MGRCESASTLSFAYTLDGVASVDVFSVDAAGNVGGNASRVMWTWDRTAPDTMVSVGESVWQSRLSAWLVNNSTATLTLSATEAAHFHVIVDGVALSDAVRSPSLQLSLAAGRHVVAVTAVDVAGNVDGSPVIVGIIVDMMPPPPPRFTLLHEHGCFVLPSSPVYVCNSSDAVAFDAGCSETDSSDTAPCFVQWRMDTVLVSGSGGLGCAVGGDGEDTDAGGVWVTPTSAVVQPRPAVDGQYRVW
jgi:hypothetical protein